MGPAVESKAPAVANRPLGDSRVPAAAAAKGNEHWAAFQGAFLRVLEETARQAVQALPQAQRPAGGAGGMDGATDIRKTVSDAVTSVLLETSLLDKLIERHLKAHPPATKAGPAGDQKPAAQGDVRGLIQSEMKAFLASQELKEMLDEKFRSITLYLKNEVIPKAIASAQKHRSA